MKIKPGEEYLLWELAADGWRIIRSPITLNIGTCRYQIFYAIKGHAVHPMWEMLAGGGIHRHTIGVAIDHMSLLGERLRRMEIEDSALAKFICEKILDRD